MVVEEDKGIGVIRFVLLVLLPLWGGGGEFVWICLFTNAFAFLGIALTCIDEREDVVGLKADKNGRATRSDARFDSLARCKECLQSKKAVVEGGRN